MSGIRPQRSYVRRSCVAIGLMSVGLLSKSTKMRVSLQQIMIKCLLSVRAVCGYRVAQNINIFTNNFSTPLLNVIRGMR